MFFTILKIVTAVGGLLIAGISAIAAARRSSNQGSHTLVTSGAYSRTYSNSGYNGYSRYGSYTRPHNTNRVIKFPEGVSIFGFVPCPKVAHTGNIPADVDNVIDAVNEIGDKVDTLQDALVQVSNNKAMPIIPVVNPAGDPVEDMAVRNHANVVPLQRTVQAPTHTLMSPYPVSQLGQAAVIGHNNFVMANGFDQAYDRSMLEFVQRGFCGQQQQQQPPYMQPALPYQQPAQNLNNPILNNQNSQTQQNGCFKDWNTPIDITPASTIPLPIQSGPRVEPYSNQIPR